MLSPWLLDSGVEEISISPLPNHASPLFKTHLKTHPSQNLSWLIASNYLHSASSLCKCCIKLYFWHVHLRGALKYKYIILPSTSMGHNICWDDKGITTFIARLLTVTKLGLFYFFSITPWTFFSSVNRSKETNSLATRGHLFLSENGKEPITVLCVFHFSGKSTTTSDFVVIALFCFWWLLFCILAGTVLFKVFHRMQKEVKAHLTSLSGQVSSLLPWEHITYCGDDCLLVRVKQGIHGEQVMIVKYSIFYCLLPRLLVSCLLPRLLVSFR